MDPMQLLLQLGLLRGGGQRQGVPMARADVAPQIDSSVLQMMLKKINGDQKRQEQVHWAELAESMGQLRTMQPAVQKALIEGEIVPNMLAGLPVLPRPELRAVREFMTALFG
jgi:hypothetical protein